MTHTDKQPQTVSPEILKEIEVESEYKYPLHYKFPGNNRNDFLAYHTAKQQGFRAGAEWMVANKELLSKAGYITPEELQALKGEWQREQWISVDDKKDLKEWDNVLVTNGTCVFNGYLYENKFHFDHDQSTNDDDATITHWMPLPQPPKP